ncbi:MAG: hypothetical protein ACJ705_08980 [Nitrososphaeraceae archaeon]
MIYSLYVSNHVIIGVHVAGYTYQLSHKELADSNRLYGKKHRPKLKPSLQDRIGHSGSTYWRKKESEKAELFRKIEPYLTFLNIHQLERQGADIQSKVQELEDLNSSLRERDKVKDDATAHLSDQLLAFSTRLEQLERKQQTTILS